MCLQAGRCYMRQQKKCEGSWSARRMRVRAGEGAGAGVDSADVKQIVLW